MNNHTCFLFSANQILSIMKKPIAQDNISAVGGDAPVEQFNSRSSELLHLDDDSQTFDDSLQADRCQVINAVDKHNAQKAVDGEGNRTCYEGNGPQSEATYIDSAASPVNADYSINSVESAVSTQRMKILGSNAFESPCKSQSSIDHGKSVVLESSKGKFELRAFCILLSSYQKEFDYFQNMFLGGQRKA